MKILLSLLVSLIFCGEAAAQPATTKPNVSNLLTQCLANVPVVGNGTSTPPVCWSTGALTSIAHVTPGTGINAVLALGANASGGVVAPTPTRAGDVAYWNGTAWVTLAGNNSGTQVFSENPSGVPGWITPSGGGTVTSVICGTGLSGGTITSSGTCALNAATTNLTDTTAPSAWTPTDASGAGLTFSTITAFYTKIGKIVTAQLRLTYPATANGTTASIGGLPVAASASAPAGGWTTGTCITSAPSNTIAAAQIASSATSFTLFNIGAASSTNANLTGAIISCTLTYISS